MSRFLALFFSLFITVAANAQQIRSIRVDPGYLYDTHSGQTASNMAVNVVRDLKYMGINTVFLYAYNHVYGAWYPTTYAHTAVEPDLGRNNIFGAITKEAKAQGLKVVAIMPVNNFKHVWLAQPSWRSKKQDGSDYKPDSNSYMMSAWHDSYKSWFRGLLRDFLAKNPNVDGIEAVEGQVVTWGSAADYNPVATQKFKSTYPGYALGGTTWKKHRARGLTLLHAALAEEAHAKYKKAFVVQTWSAKPDGSLMASYDIRQGCGFDFDGIMNLTGTSKPDYMQAELMWQQWKAEYGSSVFTPTWTETAGKKFVSNVAGRVKPIVHIEISNFSGSAGYTSPTISQFQQNVQAAENVGVAVDIYDYNQIKTRNAMDSVRSVFMY